MKLKIRGRLLLFCAPLCLAGAATALMALDERPATQAAPVVPRAVLERYVGRYELNGTIVTVALTEDNQLTVQLTGQPVGPPLRTVSANEFYGEEAGVRIFFEGDGPKATRIRSQFAGQEVVGSRIPDDGSAAPRPPVPVNSALAPYASTADAVRLPDGRMLNFVCMGEGSPTVILTAGMGNTSFDGWAMVQPAMAKTTRVCAWDRPGFGLSDGSPGKQTVATTTADLAAALAAGSIPGPYVMVGHSLGGFESLLFADRHPDKVVGMVLVDPSYPGQHAAGERIGLRTSDPAESAPIKRLRTCAADIRAGSAKLGGPDRNGCFQYPPMFPPTLARALGEKVSNPIQYETMASFLASFAEDSAIATNAARSYGDMPLIVLTAGVVPPPPPNAPPEDVRMLAAVQSEWNGAHDALAALSTRGINARVPGANHGIQATRPQVVVDAVEAVVAEARAAGR